MLKPISRSRAVDPTKHASFKEFDHWLKTYLSTKDEKARRHLAKTGVPLATRRALHMRLLMEYSPQEAVAHAMSAKDRAALPSAIRKHVEEHVQGRGEFFATIACGLNGQTHRSFSARIGKRTFVAFVPRDGKFRNMPDGKLKGVALGSLVALEEIVPMRPSRAGQKVAGIPQAVLAAAPGLPSRLDVSGTLRCLVIRARFTNPDLPNLDPVSLSSAEATMNGVNSNLQAWSRGRLSLTWDITATYTLPRTKEGYAFATEGNAVYDLHADARALADPQWHSETYDKVIVVFPDACHFRDPVTLVEQIKGHFCVPIAWLGLAQLGVPGVSQARLIWMQDNFSQDVLAHELGHTFSLEHANRLNAGAAVVVNDGPFTEYADTFDTMGFATADPPARRWFNPLYLYSIGWRDANEVILVDEPGDYTIRRFDHLQASGPQALVISREPAYYWVGNRGAFPDATDLKDGAYVVLVEPNRSRCSLLLDFTPSTGSIADAALDQNTVFVDVTYGITLEVIDHGGVDENAYITVRVGFSEDRPVIINQPQSITGVFGTSASQMHVDAGGTHPLHYQWLRDGAPVDFGTDSPTLVFPALLEEHAGVYTVVVTNDFGSTESGPATLTVVHDPPVLVSRSSYRNVTSELGSSTFSVEIRSTLEVTYAWTRETLDPQSHPSWVSAPVGGSTASLTVGPTSPAFEPNAFGVSRYICIASTRAGFVRVPFVLKVMPSYLTVITWGAMTEHYDPYDYRGVAAIGAGNQYSVALRWNGTLDARGNGRSTADLAALTDVTAIAIGDFYCWVLRSDGSVWEWVGTRAPAAVPGLTNIIAISVCHEHRIALRNDGTIEEFGNAYGYYAPPDLKNVADISAGRYHGMALLNDGSVRVWGLGNPTFADAVGIACGDDHALILKADGKVVGVGTNAAAQIPNTLQEGWVYSAMELSGGSAHSLALRYHPVPPSSPEIEAPIQVITTVEGWGDNSSGQATPPSWPAERAWGVAAGTSHSLLMMPFWRG